MTRTVNSPQSSKRSLGPFLVLAANAIWYLCLGGGVVLGVWTIISFTGVHGSPDTMSIQVWGLNLRFDPRYFADDKPLSWALAIVLPQMGIAMYIVKQLKRILVPMALGRPFSPEVPSAVMCVGNALIVVAAYRTMASIGFGKAVAASLAVPGVAFEPRLSVDISTWLCGILVLALAEVFRQGLAMKEDNDLIVCVAKRGAPCQS